MGRSLLLGRNELLQHLANLRRERIAGGEAQELLVGGDRHGGVAGRLCGLAELHLCGRVVRRQRGDLLVDPLCARRGLAVLLDQACGARARVAGERLRDRALEAGRAVEDLAERRRRRGRERGRRVGDLRGRLGVLCLGGKVARLRAVLRRELLQRARVLGAQRGVAREGGDRVRRAVLLLVRGGEVAPVGGVLRVLVDLVLEVRDRWAAAAVRVEEVLQRARDTARAGADTQEREGGGEADRQEDVDPLRVVPEPREEQLLLPLRRLLAVRLRRRRYGSRRPSICPRAALAMLRTSGHSLSPVRYLVVPSTIVSSTRSGEPPYTTAAAGSSTGW